MPKRERAEYMRNYRAAKKTKFECIECQNPPTTGSVRCIKHTWNRRFWKQRTPEERAVAAAMKPPPRRRLSRKKPKTDYLRK